MEPREFANAIANGTASLARDAETKQLKQDINDLMSYLGDVVRGPCGHLRVVGFVCPCRVDHSK